MSVLRRPQVLRSFDFTAKHGMKLYSGRVGVKLARRLVSLMYGGKMECMSRIR